MLDDFLSGLMPMMPSSGSGGFNAIPDFGAASAMPGGSSSMPFDPAVGANATAPWSMPSADMQAPMQIASRTGATNGTQDPNFMQVLMQLLQNTRTGRNVNAASNFFGDPLKYGSGSQPISAPAMPAMSPMPAADGMGVGGILALIEMY